MLNLNPNLNEDSAAKKAMEEVRRELDTLADHQKEVEPPYEEEEDTDDDEVTDAGDDSMTAEPGKKQN